MGQRAFASSRGVLWEYNLVCEVTPVILHGVLSREIPDAPTSLDAESTCGEVEVLSCSMGADLLVA